MSKNMMTELMISNSSGRCAYHKRGQEYLRFEKRICLKPMDSCC